LDQGGLQKKQQEGGGKEKNKISVNTTSRDQEREVKIDWKGGTKEEGIQNNAFTQYQSLACWEGKKAVKRINTNRGERSE